MSLPLYSIAQQHADQQPEIEQLLDDVFGLSRRTKTSYRLREGERPLDGLSFVALAPGGDILGAISFWTLHIGETGSGALLLGPLAVAPAFHGKGIGRALMRHGLTEAKQLGHRLVILVGDEPYYGRVGFRKVPDGHLVMPGPVDAGRLLYLELQKDALAESNGLVLSPGKFVPKPATCLRGTTSG
ncbi:MAG: GNAT family N-acetyltransferase [Aestuariivirgaceae bacterium]